MICLLPTIQKLGSVPETSLKARLCECSVYISLMQKDFVESRETIMAKLLLVNSGMKPCWDSNLFEQKSIPELTASYRMYLAEQPDPQ